MQTTTARAIYEVMKRRIVVMSITFHGGTRAVGYPWGAPNHMIGFKSTEAPDKRAADAFGAIAIKYSNLTTAFGPMTDTVYEVSGGMEDWAYAASWESSQSLNPITNCSAPNYLITGYNNWSFRQLMYLVEMDDDKNPPSSQMGEVTEVFTGLGLVPTYLRFSLAAITLAKPFLDIYMIPVSNRTFQLIWTVRGCEEVDLTWVMIQSYTDLTWKKLTKSDYYLHEDISNFDTYKEPQRGTCSLSTPHLFRELISLNETSVILVAANVDSKWRLQTTPDPNVPPQTHLVRMRTETDYFIDSGEFSLVSNSTTYSSPRVLNTSALLINAKTRLVAVLLDYQNREQGRLTLEEYSAFPFLYLNLTLSSGELATLSVGEFGDLRVPENSSWGHISSMKRLACHGIPQLGYWMTPYEVTFEVCSNSSLQAVIGHAAVVSTSKNTFFGVLEAEETQYSTAGGFSDQGICLFHSNGTVLGGFSLGIGTDAGKTDLRGYFFDRNLYGKYSISVNGLQTTIEIPQNETYPVMTNTVSVDGTIKALFGRPITILKDQELVSRCVIGLFNPGHADPYLNRPHGPGRKTYEVLYFLGGGTFLGVIIVLATLCWCYQKKKYSQLKEPTSEIYMV